MAKRRSLEDRLAEIEETKERLALLKRKQEIEVQLKSMKKRRRRR